MRGSPEPGVGDKPVSRGLEGVETKAFPASSSDTPQNLFPVRIARKAFPNVTRFVHRWDRGTFLIYTDGACLNNGQGGAQAGWACVFGPQEEGITTTISGRLENQGPFQEAAEQTSNRAELRAVIGALRFRHWVAEGFSKLVIATDSDYVFKGATERMEGWMLRGWKTSKGAAVKNRDLWEAFCGEAERWDDREMEIQFRKIPREMNAKADGLAKNAAEGDDVEEFFDLSDR